MQAHWCCRIVVDSTGLGSGTAAFLGAALGPRSCAPSSSAATKSHLTYGLLGGLNAQNLAVHAESVDGEANAARRTLPPKQAEAVVCSLRVNQRMAFNVSGQLGHDDQLNMLALLTQAVEIGAARQPPADPAAPPCTAPSATPPEPGASRG